MTDLAFLSLLVLSILHYEAVSAVSTGSIESSRGIPKVATTGSSTTARIVNGEDVPVGRYSWIVSLQKITPRLKHVCGGSLIAPDMVLSAAHCYIATEEVAVRINPHTLDDPQPGSQLLSVITSVIHPRSDTSTRQNDLWVLRLNGTVELPLLKLNPKSQLPHVNQSLTVAGWGVLQYDTLLYPQVLQRTQQLHYIPNRQCINMSTSFRGRVTSDMLCAYAEGYDACAGDSGGPLFIEGDSVGEDEQVGVVSWGVGCGQINEPGVYSRVSSGYEWLRGRVCELSDYPPNYFQCDGIGSSSPTTMPITALVQVQLDTNPEDTIWTIRASNGDIIAKSPFYPRNEFNTAKRATVTLNERESYALEVEYMPFDESPFLGSVLLFLGQVEDFDRVLAFVDGDFGSFITVEFVASRDSVLLLDHPTANPSTTLFPSSTPTNSPRPTGVMQPVTLLINFDTYSSVTLSWEITTVDGNVVKKAPIGTYTPFDGDVVTETFNLQSGGKYVFSVLDSDADGICCTTGDGYLALFWGDTVNRDRVLFWDSGEFGAGRSQQFRVSLRSTFALTPAPIDSPSGSPAPTSTAAPSHLLVDVVVEFHFDRFPADISMQISSRNGEVIIDEPTGSFPSSSANSVLNRTYSLPANEQFLLAVYDANKDGLCCLYGDGQVMVYQEEVGEDTVLLMLDGDFNATQQGTFLTSPSGIMAEFGVAVLTTAPTISPSIRTPSDAADLPSSNSWSTVERTPIWIGIAGFVMTL